MEPLRFALGFSLADTLLTSLIIASFNDVSLVFLAAPLGLSSVGRTITATVSVSRWGECVARKSLALSNAFAVLSVTVFVYFALVLRNSVHIVKAQGISVDNALRAKVGVLLVCALGAAVATSAVLYTVLRSSRRSAWENEKNAEMCSLTLEDVTLRLFVFEAVANAEIGSPTMDSSDACCICLDEYQPGDVICELVCHHKFHKSCVEEWTRTDVKESSKLCPLRCAVSAMSQASTGAAPGENSV
eukprot:TRINITY_DN29929_c0_g1_i1.p1 TRINITY_DN29929_c0_g1~~TRINITY_DN29929_c0_g1_i1.p1  ORF type:complete len:245 (+),score=25.91 TRINITY_DN29929_c0_g1_i1:94-828(+)